MHSSAHIWGPTLSGIHGLSGCSAERSGGGKAVAPPGLLANAELTEWRVSTLSSQHIHLFDEILESCHRRRRAAAGRGV